MNIHDEISKLLPNLGALQNRITMAKLVTLDSYRKTAFGLEQLPYCLGAALSAIEKATEQQEEVIRSVDLSTLRPNVDYSIPDHKRDRIAYELDAFFEAAVRTQNGLWPYLRYIEKRSLPYSFRKLVEQVIKGNVSFGGAIDGAIKDYWVSSGSRLRAYRDLSQHSVVLPSNAHVVINDGQIKSFFMPLPSNPEEKRPLELIYNKDSPNAVSYIIDAFMTLSHFLRTVIREILGSDIRKPRAVHCHMFKEGSIGSSMRTGAIVTADILRERLDAMITEFKVET